MWWFMCSCSAMFVRRLLEVLPSVSAIHFFVGALELLPFGRWMVSLDTYMMKSDDGDNGRKDVLFLKGAAAQQTTHPGNLAYYALCEAKYEKYAALPDSHPSKAQICRDIVDEVLRSGGKFRSPTGGTMTHAAAMQKTKDRMRQIAKPKIRPDHVNDNDVVFTRGANNHLYAGNAKWRTLLDHYVLDYYKEYIANGLNDSGGPNKRQQYQIDIINEITSIVRGRGGTFRRGDNLEELDNDEIIKKTNARFKDLKKQLKKGKVFPQRSAAICITSAASAKVNMEEESTGNDDAARNGNVLAQSAMVTDEKYILKKTGCTSVKRAVKTKKDLQNLEKEMRPKWHKPASKRVKRSSGPKIKEDEEDDDGYDSSMLASDNEDDNDSVSDDEEDAHALIRLGSEKQKMDRSERLKRRRSGQPASPRRDASKKPRTKKIKKEEKDEEDGGDEDMPKYELSEYEKLREEKIKRNQQRLVELGLV